MISKSAKMQEGLFCLKHAPWLFSLVYIIMLKFWSHALKKIPKSKDYYKQYKVNEEHFKVYVHLCLKNAS